MARSTNPYAHYGSPILGAALATTAFAGFVLAIGGEEFRKAYAVPIVLSAFYLTVISFLIWLVFDTRSQRFKLPEVAKVIGEDLILLCRPVDWLGMGAAVSVYRNDGDYERVVASAEVINVQQNGLVQIKLLGSSEVPEEREHAVQELSKIDKASFVIKPGGLKGEW